MQTFSDIIDAFGGTRAFALAINIPESHARTMKARGSIPAERWSRLVQAAKEHRVRGVTLEVLARIAASRKSSPEQASGEVA